MREILVKDVVRICKGEILIGKENEKLGGFIQDTREIKEGTTYIGFKGGKNDGN